jgi:hypothetical protein
MTLIYRDAGSPEADLVVGGRLLVHLRRPETHAQAEAALGDWVTRGREARDRGGLNRFRLVLGLATDALGADRLQAQFGTLAAGDPRLHLHLLPPQALDSVLDRG